MSFQQSSPMAKFDNSPAESLLSIPGDPYSSLFAAVTPSAATTMNPMEMMTPKSFTDDKNSSLPTVKEEERESSESPSPTSDKKSSKKRKSWGQVLPEPKTNLPPRKRAKTEDEKEQRRVERVLRNRRAAQSSRERKRLEVEALEKRNKQLEDMLHESQKTNLVLAQELDRFRRTSGIVTRSSSPLDSLRENPVTLSQELFSSQDAHKALEDLMNPHTTTVNPSSISPCLSPVADASEEHIKQEPIVEANLMSHVGGDAQVVPGVANLDAANLGLAPAASDDAAFSLGDSFVMPTATDADRYVLESGLLASPHSSAIGDDYMAGNTPAFSLYDDFDISDFLNDDANPMSSEFNSASDFAAATLGLEPKVNDSETQVPSENPNQQPLPGASSLGCDVGGLATDGSRGDTGELTRYLSDMGMPSKEVLMALLWTLKVYEKRSRQKSSAVLDSETRSQGEPTTKHNLPLVKGVKRNMANLGSAVTKRSRMS
ncbi:hypothetical protein FZEAL_1739 [Fusarium zealandicum]|uniref:BZIP domain-containing protein n=1 Tax=Fusarium zealandicum TaxID=1053134 RepID=A0A8H4XNG8_9HYPO|nr:hypothetical protein FZEAL_1739 [Fusarium zealandicum]